MNKLSIEKRLKIVSMLFEGNSLCSTSRIADVLINTVVKLLIDVGTAYEAYYNENVISLKSTTAQCDEIWSFVYAKQKKAPVEMQQQTCVGDFYTWTGVNADSKFIISWNAVNRDAETAKEFIKDVASRLANRVQLITDELAKHLKAVNGAFVNNIYFTQLIKVYGKPQ